MKIAISFVIGLSIGVLCRWFDVPVPAPPKLVGALLVLSITIGYIGTDMIIERRESRMEQYGAGPTGESAHPERRGPQ
jgi:XapX domain-containing protein